jgi:cysteinyl-tRNA synthetase
VEAGVRDPEELGLPYLRATSKLRDELRRTALSAAPEVKKSIHTLSDRIRDFDLTNIGVYLDDRPDGQPSLIKFIPAAKLIADREAKDAEEAKRAKAKEESRLSKEKKEAEERKKAKIPTNQLLDNDERFSEDRESGLPTKLKDGSTVPKSLLKKLKKELDAHERLREKYPE